MANWANGRPRFTGLVEADHVRFRKQVELRRRAEDVLELIVNEFKSDPQSVQCFDLRIVREAIEVVREIKDLKALEPF